MRRRTKVGNLVGLFSWENASVGLGSVPFGVLNVVFEIGHFRVGGRPVQADNFPGTAIDGVPIRQLCVHLHVAGREPAKPVFDLAVGGRVVLHGDLRLEQPIDPIFLHLDNIDYIGIIDNFGLARAESQRGNDAASYRRPDRQHFGNS